MKRCQGKAFYICMYINPNGMTVVNDDSAMLLTAKESPTWKPPNWNRFRSFIFAPKFLEEDSSRVWEIQTSKIPKNKLEQKVHGGGGGLSSCICMYHLKKGKKGLFPNERLVSYLKGRYSYVLRPREQPPGRTNCPRITIATYINRAWSRGVESACWMEKNRRIQSVGSEGAWHTARLVTYRRDHHFAAHLCMYVCTSTIYIRIA